MESTPLSFRCSGRRSRRDWLRGVMGVLAGGSLVLGAAEPPPVRRPDEWTQAGVETYLNFARQRGSQPLGSGTSIPKKYWAPILTELKPKRVYTHGANLVVVQRTKGRTEEGIYLFLPMSSTLPQSGRDGFTLTPDPMQPEGYHLGTGVFEFTRTPPPKSR